MRKVMEKQLKIGQVDISNIQIDLNSRDEIPQVLLGLQAIYSDRRIRNEVFSILHRVVPENVDSGNGRPGMDLWKILVLGTLRLNCNWDYDKLHNIANNHKSAREFLGHTIFEFDKVYALQTLKDNISLLTPEVLDEINKVVVTAGHNLFRKEQGSLRGRCDSFVVETDVHYPTDINLLWDAIRKVIELIGQECEQLGITEWRQRQHILRKIKKLFNRSRKLKRSNSKDKQKKTTTDQLIIKAHQEYIDLTEQYIKQARITIATLNELAIGNVARIMLIEHFIGHAERQMDQIRRRVIKDEKIPHSEKAFSIFEEHTEWISKGKAGVPQELGLKVCILEDQYGFILHHRVMENQTDDQIAVAMVTKAKRKFSALNGCSFDKGFHSPKNQEDLQRLLDNVVLPRKGKLSLKAKEIEHSESFIEARRKHSAVESAINALENHALDRCPDHGIIGFKRYVALAVLARNIQILGAKIQQKALKRLMRCKRAESLYRLAA